MLQQEKYNFAEGVATPSFFSNDCFLLILQIKQNIRFLYNINTTIINLSIY